jgi:glucose-1-phosphate adenylyltransferase
VGAEIERAVIGIRTRVGRGAQIRNSLVLGADFFETVEDMGRAQARGLPPVGIGSDSVVENAIVDKNARIGRGVRIANHSGEAERDGDGWHIRDGIVVVTKDAVIPDGAVI